VTFDPKWGGPDQPVAFSTLDDWSKRTEEGIKYYSGTAVYNKTFDLPSVPATETKVALGSVAVMAEVTLNGQNRLIGDLRLPKEQRVAQLTETTGFQFYTPGARLFPSGLLGPVTLQTAGMITIQPTGIKK
jgi:hypothetical protein